MSLGAGGDAEGQALSPAAVAVLLGPPAGAAAGGAGSLGSQPNPSVFLNVGIFAIIQILCINGELRVQRTQREKAGRGAEQAGAKGKAGGEVMRQQNMPVWSRLCLTLLLLIPPTS